MRAASARRPSPHVPRVSQGVAAGLWPHTEPVRLAGDRDSRDHVTGTGVEDVDLAVVATREPELLAVRRDAAHVGAAAAGNGPRVDDLVRAEGDHADLAGASVRHVEHLR